MESKEHWEKVYASKSETEVSWFQEHARLSLQILRDAGVPRDAAIIDVGAGASHFVDDCLREGYRDLTVLDVSKAALAAARARLGKRASDVHWLEANVLDADLPAHAYDVWHDRAVFHFLTDSSGRQAYVRQVLRAVKPGGLVIVATFAKDGPTLCSGLPVMRYSPSALHAEFGAAFTLLGHHREAHQTPAGKEQPFVYCLCRMDSGALEASPED
ncbi:Methyltransferase type 12 [Thioalkalivibrio nitratireducens DSM 14787]|uniref:Methyltransferase type 12 n=1 Tax=Thioalkalivibrio nitratireducens (strain DSM 14787 / UNIQEM 213 / ALEN2) TaxID=1255043 RepID=L0DWK4_THIND|nr:class I SAM-dependent methyltransferase [Thioalkalivibrio nitratireducens]AGA33408.1 Methyltransferase type 12 [Thioalkalivibrio nitratireducens DSM 14787]